MLLAIFALVIFAFPIGFQAVAYAFLILGVLEVVVVTWLLVRVLDLNIITFYRTLLPNLLISLVCAAATYAISIWIPFEAEPAWKPICVIALFLPLSGYCRWWLSDIHCIKKLVLQHDVKFRTFRSLRDISVG